MEGVAKIVVAICLVAAVFLAWILVKIDSRDAPCPAGMYRVGQYNSSSTLCVVGFNRKE